MTPSRVDGTLGCATGADRPATRSGEAAMTQERIVERTTVTESSAAPRETVEKDYVAGVPHGDEEAGARSAVRSAVRSAARSAAPSLARSLAGPWGPSSEARSARPRAPRPARSTRRPRTTRSSPHAKSGADSSHEPDR